VKFTRSGAALGLLIAGGLVLSACGGHSNGSTNQTVLPFPNLSALWGIAMDNSGTVYVADRGDDRVVRLAP